jgi:hypothetical protein
LTREDVMAAEEGGGKKRRGRKKKERSSDRTVMTKRKPPPLEQSIGEGCALAPSPQVCNNIIVTDIIISQLLCCYIIT